LAAVPGHPDAIIIQSSPWGLKAVLAGAETLDRELNCRACVCPLISPRFVRAAPGPFGWLAMRFTTLRGAPFPARDGQFVLKYFLLQKPSRRQR
jgi:hypothetical protein